MKPIQSLEQQILRRFPAARMTLDPAETPDGSWFLDIELDGHTLAIQWRADRGFGVTANPGAGYGEGADEVYADLETTSQRVLSLLLTQGRTVPPDAVRLKELRGERRLSQVELAGRLRVNQAAVSKLEKRSDIHLRTLRDVIAAMGGRLIIRASFPDGMERDLRFDDEAEVAASRPVPTGN